jgi:hypothetical protein
MHALDSERATLCANVVEYQLYFYVAILKDGMVVPSDDDV